MTDLDELDILESVFNSNDVLPEDKHEKAIKILYLFKKEWKYKRVYNVSEIETEEKQENLDNHYLLHTNRISEMMREIISLIRTLRNL